MPQITLPTRVTGRTAALIDNIVINSYEIDVTSGNITTSVSNLLPQFLIIENFKTLKQLSEIAKILIANLFKTIIKKSSRH